MFLALDASKPVRLVTSCSSTSVPIAVPHVVYPTSAQLHDFFKKHTTTFNSHMLRSMGLTSGVIDRHSQGIVSSIPHVKWNSRHDIGFRADNSLGSHIDRAPFFVRSNLSKDLEQHLSSVSSLRLEKPKILAVRHDTPDTHPDVLLFHQKSFHDLVSASPLAVKTKGKVSKPARFDPGLANSVSKSRGSRQRSRNNVAGIPVDFSGANIPHKCQTRIAGGKPSIVKPTDNVNTSRSTCLHKSGDNTANTSWSQIAGIENELKIPRHDQINLSTAAALNNQSTEACSQMLSKENESTNQIDEHSKSSTIGGIVNQSAEAFSQLPSKENELKNHTDEQGKLATAAGPLNQSAEGCSQMPGKGNELKNPFDIQVKASEVGDLNNQSTVLDIRAPMSRTTGLLSMLKMSSLRRSCGMLPMRVEVKDIQPKERKSSNKKSTESLSGRNRKSSSIGSTSNNSQQVKKDDKIKLLKNPVRKSYISPIEHNSKKSSIGSSSTIVEKTEKGCEAAVTKIQSRGAPKAVGWKQGQPIGEASGKLRKSRGQLIGGRICDGALSMHTKTASRRPLQDVHNVGQSQRQVVLQNQRFAGKENNHLGTIQNKKVDRVEGKKPLTSIKGILHDQEKLKVTAQPKAKSVIHSTKDIKQ
ncbi:hypothetical protein KI387_014275, partial [Taxus chinensis]